MRTRTRIVVAVCALFLLAPLSAALAQTDVPPPPPPGWAGSLGTGVAVSRGNSDTATINLSYNLLHDGGSDFVFESTGIYLRGENSGKANVDRAAVDVRLDYRLSSRLSAFALTSYARDAFKDIDYLVAPTGGLSYKAVAAERVEWTTDASAGLVLEKNTGFGVESSAALLAGERFVFTVNPSTRLVHAATALWKVDDFNDGYYTMSLGVATSMARHLELKTEFLNTYKARPTDPTLVKNDQSLVVSVVYQF